MNAKIKDVVLIFRVIGIALLVLMLVVTVLAFFFAPPIASLAFLLGGLILVCGYYHLIYLLPKVAKDTETQINMEALRASFWLVIFGMIIITLGFLYLMNLLPPQGL